MPTTVSNYTRNGNKVALKFENEIKIVIHTKLMWGGTFEKWLLVF